MDVLPPEARRERIVALIAEDGFIRVAEAGHLLGVSDVTLRADLAFLAKAGLIRRVHGGALPVLGHGRESSVETTATQEAQAKREIGRRAAAFVTSGSSVLLDVGSTALAVASALIERRELVDVTVITNGLSIALALEPAVPRLTVVVTGGTLRPLQHSLVNPLAAQTLTGLHADLAILGCNGIDEEGRVTNVNLPETEVKRAMIAASDRRILMADSSKAGHRHLGLIGQLSDFDALVTDSDSTGGLAEIASHADVALVLCGRVSNSK